jgi:FtsP/CotA-like multicopper oxidase with cupredoxin domain
MVRSGYLIYQNDKLTSAVGQFPGPWIEARSGDDIIIELHNDLVGENVAIHWHGLWMCGKFVKKRVGLSVQMAWHYLLRSCSDV